MTHFEVSVRHEDWPLAKPFRIARGARTHIDLVVVEVSDVTATGRGESCPTAHYGESVESVIAGVEAIADQLRAGRDWDTIHDGIAAGAARNAVDCAIWDWRAKRAGKPVSELLGMGPPTPVETVFTISLAASDIMAEAARAASGHAILKLKLGAAGDVAGDMERVRAVRAAVPDKRLIVDVNEGWTPADLEAAMPVMADCGIEMLEQPLPAGRDDALRDIKHLVPVGADESCHTTRDLDRVSALYDVINIKLDKTGGLTEAMRLMQAGRERGLQIMVGCMLGTSLAMAPGFLVAQFARFVDLDAPLLIGADRKGGLVYRGGIIEPPDPALWG